MADRVFCTLLLALSVGYAWLAFTVVKAPFQYDPLGPEGWPRILACLMIPCLIVIVARPDVHVVDAGRGALVRLSATLALLLVYTELYEPAGFVLATIGFAALLSRLLGAPWLRAGGFGLLAGVAGYGIAAGLLGLNLPAGPLPRL